MKIFSCFRVVEGREVVVPTNTFFATPAAVIHAGGRPRFADVDRATMGVTVDSVATAIRPETTAVIVVHIGGTISPEMPEIAALCRDRDLFLVEDAAQPTPAPCTAGWPGPSGRRRRFPSTRRRSSPPGRAG